MHSTLFRHSRAGGNPISRFIKIPAFAGMTILAVLSFIPPALAADKYEFDKSHTNIVFFIDHVGFSQMIGRFTEFDGAFTFDEKAPEQSTIDVTIKPKGVRTSSEALDAHLQKPEFFNTEKFPDIRFVGTGIKVTGKNTGDVSGNITMLGVTKPGVLHVTLNKVGVHPISQDTIAGFSADAVIKRSEFGMTQGIPMVGDEVKLHIETEAVNLDRKKATELKR